MYSPTLGRWMQNDPLGNADTLDLYLLEHANPVSLVDPSGLRPQLPWGYGYLQNYELNDLLSRLAQQNFRDFRGDEFNALTLELAWRAHCDPELQGWLDGYLNELDDAIKDVQDGIQDWDKIIQNTLHAQSKFVVPNLPNSQNSIWMIYRSAIEQYGLMKQKLLDRYAYLQALKAQIAQNIKIAALTPCQCEVEGPNRP